MRWQLLTLFLTAGVALAQTQTQQPATPGLVIQGGYASTPVTAPSVVTPHVTLTTASPNPVGATSSAYGLQVGATSAAVPSAAGPGPTLNEAIVTTSTSSPAPITGTPAATIVASGQQAAAPATGQTNGESSANQATNGNQITITGGYIPPAQSGPDVADAARYYRTHPMKAVKVYTNDDINRLNENTSNTASAGGSNLPASDVNVPANDRPADQIKPSNIGTTPSDQTRQPQTQNQPESQPSAAAPASKPKPYTPPPTAPQQ